MNSSLAYEFGNCHLNIASRELSRDGEVVTLPYRVFDCLAYLVQHRDRAVDRDELVRAIWGHADISDAQLGQIILRARRAVGDDGNRQDAIRTIPRFGYHWVAPVREISDAPVTETAAPAAEATAETDEPARPAPSPLKRLWLIVAIITVMLAAVVLLTLPRPGPDQTGAATGTGTLVLPLDVEAGEDVGWVRLGGMDMLAEYLRSAGLQVPATESMLAMLQGLKQRHAMDQPGALDRVRESAGAEWLIQGQLGMDNGLWQMHLTALSGHRPPLRVRARAADPLAAVRAGADRLLIELGRVPPRLPAGNGVTETVLRQAKAALLADQLEVARSLLQADPQLLADQPRLRYTLAQVDFRAGRMDTVRQTMQTLLEEPGLTGQPLLHGRVLNTLGAVHYNMDDWETAETYHDRAVQVLIDAGDPTELGRALAGRGAARGVQQRFDESLQDFSLARLELDRAGDRLVMARTHLMMASLELSRSRLTQARPLLENAIGELEHFGAVAEQLYGLTLLFRLELAELRYADAAATNDRAWTLRQRAADPLRRQWVVLDRAEILLAQGRLEQAGAVLAQLREEVPANPWITGFADWVHARLAWEQGDVQQTLASADRALARLAIPEYDFVAVNLALYRQRALIALGRIDEATEVLADFERMRPRQPAGTEPVALRITRAELARTQGRHDQAGDEFRAALTAADTSGVPESLVLATEAYARHLLDQGRLETAAAAVGRIAHWADHDFRSALARVRLHHALGQHQAWEQAVQRAEQIAGERQIPPDLLEPPPRLQLTD